jgi:nucleotide-binding universal stress UspA family protein
MEHPMASGSPARNRASVPSIRSRNPDAADPPCGNVTSLELMRPGFARGMYRVLLAHDLTGASEIALVRAARLTLEREGHLIVLHVVDGKLPARAVEAQRAHARSHLETEIRRWLGGCKLSYRVDVGVGELAGAVAARAHAHGVDLVVTGRHRRRAIADMHSPAAVGRLLQQIQRPLLVVGNPNQSPYRRVLIPFDLTDASAARLQFAAAFLPQASLHLLHAYKRRFHDYVAPLSLTLSPEEEGRKGSGPIGQQPNETVSRFIATLRLAECRPTVTIENGDALALARKEVARQKTDLLVWGAHARSGTGHGASGGAAEAALRASPCDILFLPLMDLARQPTAPRQAVGTRALSSLTRP